LPELYTKEEGDFHPHPDPPPSRGRELKLAPHRSEDLSFPAREIKVILPSQ